TKLKFEIMARYKFLNVNDYDSNYKKGEIYDESFALDGCRHVGFMAHTFPDDWQLVEEPEQLAFPRMMLVWDGNAEYDAVKRKVIGYFPEVHFEPWAVALDEGGGVFISTLRKSRNPEK